MKVENNHETSLNDYMAEKPRFHEISAHMKGMLVLLEQGAKLLRRKIDMNWYLNIGEREIPAYKRTCDALLKRSLIRFVEEDGKMDIFVLK